MIDFHKSSRFSGGGGGGRKFGGRDFGKRGFDNRSSGRAPMHRATCAECGSSCEVPFKPTNDRPVYCSNCFRKGDNGKSANFPRRSEDREYGERDRDFSKPTMHEATCDECGNTCEIPFKPTGNKPIFCNNCFKKGSNANAAPNKSTEQFREQLDILNIKLDRILKILTSPLKDRPQIAVVEKETIEVEAPVKAVKNSKSKKHPKENIEVGIEKVKISKAKKNKSKKA